MLLIEILATLFGFVYVILMIRRNIWCWVSGNLSVGLQMVSFYYVKLYADMGLQAIFFVLGIYGFLVWFIGKDRDKADIGVTNGKYLFVLLVVGGSSSVIIGWTLQEYTDAVVPFIDSTLASGSLLATYLQARKKIENWMMWIPLNLCYTILYLTRDLWLYSALYLGFAILALAGWIEWKKILAIQNANSQNEN